MPSRLEPGPRPPQTTAERVGAVTAYFLTVYRRTWRGSVVGRFVSPLLFLLSMGVALGTLVDARAGGIGGTSYLHFVVPGIVATQAMWTAVAESTYPVMSLIRWNEMYAAMLASPLRVAEVLLGNLLMIVIHLAIGTVAFVVVGALFGAFASWWAVLCIPVGILTGLAFAVPIFAFAATQRGDDGFSVLYRLVVTPLMLFSGVFYPVAQLPLVVQAIAWVTPLWHGVELCRALALGATLETMHGVHLAVLLAFVVAGWFAARRAFTRRLLA